MWANIGRSSLRSFALGAVLPLLLLADECKRYDFEIPNAGTSSLGFLLDWAGGPLQECQKRLSRTRNVLSADRDAADKQANEALRAKVNARIEKGVSPATLNRLDADYQSAKARATTLTVELSKLPFLCPCKERGESSAETSLRQERERRTSEAKKNAELAKAQEVERKAADEQRRITDVQKRAEERVQAENRRVQRAAAQKAAQERMTQAAAKETQLNRLREEAMAKEKDADARRRIKELYDSQIAATTRMRLNEEASIAAFNRETEESIRNQNIESQGSSHPGKLEPKQLELQVPKSAVFAEPPRLVNPFGGSAATISNGNVNATIPRLADPFAKTEKTPSREEFERDVKVFGVAVEQGTKFVDKQIELARTKLTGSRLNTFITEASKTRSAVKGLGHVVTGIDWFTQAVDAATAETKQQKISAAGKLAYNMASEIVKYGVEKAAPSLFGERVASVLAGPIGWVASITLSAESTGREYPEIIRDTSGSTSLKDKQQALYRLYQQYDSNKERWNRQQRSDLIDLTNVVIRESGIKANGRN